MIYVTAGFSRTLGKIVAKSNGSSAGFGSYFPTVGLGYEYKINASWNIRIDGRYSITSKDTGKVVVSDNRWDCSVKPQRTSIRLSITRNI